MNKSQILALMMRRNQQSAETDLLSIAALMAEALADIVDRLSEDEFYRFVGIGATIYNHGLLQFSEDNDDEDILTAADDELADDTLHQPPHVRSRH